LKSDKRLISGPYSQALAVAVDAVEEASGLCRNVQSALSTDALSKADRSPVTIADFGSQALICRALHRAFPSDPIIAEEDSAALRKDENAGVLASFIQRVVEVRGPTEVDEACGWVDFGNADRYSDRFWTLDPIDGTKGFLRGDQYAIALALVVEGEVALAVLGCPNLPQGTGDDSPRGFLFYAVKGQGAFELKSGVDAAPTPIRVSDVGDTKDIRFCESVEAAHSSHGDAARIAERLHIEAAPVRIDSQAKYAMLGRGQADAYLRLPKDAAYREKIWDHAAGMLVVTEAGGRVSDIHGKPLEFTHGITLADNRGIIGSNGLVHDQILEAIRALDIG
jgi:3'(2'), 5'-bisphosphate nucleotidase